MNRKWSVDEMVQELLEAKDPCTEGLSFQQVKDIVNSPFLSMRKDIEAGEIKVYRFAEFGTFFMTENRAIKSLEQIEQMLKEGKTSLKEYQRRATIFNKFLERKKKQNERQAKILARRKRNKG